MLFLFCSCSVVSVNTHKSVPPKYQPEKDRPTRNDLTKEQKMKQVKNNSYRYSHKPKKGYYANCKYNSHGKR